MYSNVFKCIWSCFYFENTKLNDTKVLTIKKWLKMRSILRWIQAQLTNDKRNIHFYVNVCGFYITEFFNENHPMPDTPDDFVGDGNEGMFEFKKQMRL